MPRCAAGDAEHVAGDALALADRERDVLEHRQAAEQLVDLEGAAEAALDPRACDSAVMSSPASRIWPATAQGAR